MAGLEGQPPAPLVSVWLTNGTRTSAGPVPGRKHLPAAEAGALVARKLAVYGDQPPAGFGGSAPSGHDAVSN